MGLSLCLPSHFRRGLRSHLLSSFRRGTASSPIQREGQVHASPPDPGEGQAHATPVRRAFRLLHHPEGSCLRLIRQALPAASFPALLSPGGSQIQVSTDHRCLSPRSDPHFPCTREAPTSTDPGGMATSWPVSHLPPPHLGQLSPSFSLTARLPTPLLATPAVGARNLTPSAVIYV